MPFDATSAALPGVQILGRGDATLGRLMALLDSTRPCALDSEWWAPKLPSGKPDQRQARLLCITLAFGDDDAHPLRPGRAAETWYVSRTMLRVLQIGPWSRGDRKLAGPLYAHALGSDADVLERNGIELPRTNQRCTMTLAWLVGLSDNRGKYGLKGIVEDRLGGLMSHIKESWLDSWEAAVAAEQTEQFRRYACEDAEECLRVAAKAEQMVAAEDEKFQRWVTGVEMPFVHALRRMQGRGLKVDVEHLGRLREELAKEIEEVEAAWSWEWPRVSISSPVQVAKEFYGSAWDARMATKVGKNGLPSCDAESVRRQAARLPEDSAGGKAARLLLRHAELTTARGTFVEPLLALATHHCGRVFGRYLQHGTGTGRLSSAEPNLQNIPVRTELGKRIRAAFVAEPGEVVLAADYSQIELRVLAHFCRTGKLVEAYQRGEDIHSRTMALLGIDRPRAKIVNFLRIYGGGPKRFAQQGGCDVPEARRIMRLYDREYPEVGRVMEAAVSAARRNGRVKTWSGRFRAMPGIDAEDRGEKAAAERRAGNTAIQGSASDLVKLALLAADQAGLPIDAQVHDELRLCCPAEEAEVHGERLKAIMEAVAPDFRVPLVAEVHSGPTWADCK